MYYGHYETAPATNTLTNTHRSTVCIHLLYCIPVSINPHTYHHIVSHRVSDCCVEASLQWISINFERSTFHGIYEASQCSTIRGLGCGWKSCQSLWLWLLNQIIGVRETVEFTKQRRTVASGCEVTRYNRNLNFYVIIL